MVALKEINSFIDVNEGDLKKIYSLIISSKLRKKLCSEPIRLGGYYCDDPADNARSIRQITDQLRSLSPEYEYVFSKEVEGSKNGFVYSDSREEFMKWAKYEMTNENGVWKEKEIRHLNELVQTKSDISS